MLIPVGIGPPLLIHLDFGREAMYNGRRRVTPDSDLSSLRDTAAGQVAFPSIIIISFGSGGGGGVGRRVVVGRPRRRWGVGRKGQGK